METTLESVRSLQKQIVRALETGKDPAPLLTQLAEVRASIAMATEREELQRITDERQALRDKAGKVQEKVQKQSDAIDRLLKLRDSIVSQLQPLIEPMRELAKLQTPSWGKEPGECYLFNDIGSFASAVKGIPEGYLPADFTYPMLEMEGGLVSADNKATEALSYFMAAYGLLAALRKGQSQLTLKKAEGLLSVDDDDETPEVELDCRVCQHQERAAIDNLLKKNKSLRDLESEFGVSRSTLSRHKNRCLNLGAVRVVRVEPESPASSANQTYFRG